MVIRVGREWMEMEIRDKNDPPVITTHLQLAAATWSKYFIRLKNITHHEKYLLPVTSWRS